MWLKLTTQLPMFSTLKVRPRGAARRHQREVETSSVPEEPLLFERQIEDGDTLQGIALKYGCPVSMNRFWESEWFLLPKRADVLQQSRLAQCCKFLSPGSPRLPVLGQGDLLPDAGIPGGRPEMTLSQLLEGMQNSITTQIGVQLVKQSH